MKAHGIIIIAGILLAFVACKSKQKSDPAPNKTPAPAPKGDDVKDTPPPIPVKPIELEPGALKWKSFTFQKASVSFDTIEGVKVRESAMGTSSYVRQNRPPIQTAVWVGDGRTMENWRKGVAHRKGFKLGKVSKLKVCGVPAELQELNIPARRMPTGFTQVPLGAQATTGSAKGAESSSKVVTPQPTPTFKVIPARVGIALGFKAKGVPVIASWSILSDKRAAFKKAEERFFASFKCAE